MGTRTLKVRKRVSGPIMGLGFRFISTEPGAIGQAMPKLHEWRRELGHKLMDLSLSVEPNFMDKWEHGLAPDPTCQHCYERHHPHCEDCTCASLVTDCGGEIDDPTMEAVR